MTPLSPAETLKVSLKEALDKSSQEIQKSLDEQIEKRAELITIVDQLKEKQKYLSIELEDRQAENKQLVTENIRLAQDKIALNVDIGNLIVEKREKTKLFDEELKQKEEAFAASINDRLKNLQESEVAVMLKEKEAADLTKQLKFKEIGLTRDRAELDKETEILANEAISVAKREVEIKSKLLELETRESTLTTKETEQKTIDSRVEDTKGDFLVKIAQLKDLADKLEVKRKELDLEKKALVLKQISLEKKEIRLNDRESVDRFNKTN